MDSDEWGEGGGVGTDGRVGTAAGPLSSMCALVVRVRTRRPCARSSSVCALVVHVRARRPCARSSSREGGGMGNDGAGGCWAVVVRGRSSSVGGGLLLAVCASSLYMRGAPSSGGTLVVRGGGFFCPWALLVVGVVVRGRWALSVVGAGWSF